MFVTTLALALAIGVSEEPIVCPIMGEPVKATSPKAEFAGAQFAFCCGGCDGAFAKDAPGAIAKNAKAGKTVGVFLFDAVTGLKIVAKDAKASSDYMGVRYYFASAENKAKFDKNAKKYATVPKQEHLQCSVEGCEVATYSESSGYADYNGVRYYAGCEGCAGKLIADPAKYATKDGLSAPKVIPFKEKN